MRILLVGGGGYWQVGAFLRKALDVRKYDYAFVDEEKCLRPLRESIMHKVAYRVLGRRPLTYSAFNRNIVETAQAFRPEVVLVTKGAYISPRTLARVRTETRAILVNFATDDPFSPASSNTRDLLAGIPFYELYVCTKRAIMEDVKRAGCQNVTYVPFGYEPTLHFPELPVSATELQRFASDVAFIGGPDQDRLPYFEAIVKAISGFQLHLYGGNWNRQAALRPCSCGMAFGRDYRLALGGTKIAVGLVRRANRDGHSMRSFEIPACGAFMLAERTEEHLEFFDEGKEAAYFCSVEEFVDKVRYYLRHETERQHIAEAGYRKVLTGRQTYENRLERVLNAARPLVRSGPGVPSLPVCAL